MHIPIILRRVIVSFKNIRLNIATKINPLASRIGAEERGIYFKASIVIKVEIKNKPYAKITRKLRYCCNPFCCSRFAERFKITCEMEEIKTDSKKTEV